MGDCYLQALRHDPNSATVWHILGHQGGGQVGDKEHNAKDCFLQALKHDPNHAIAWYNLGTEGGGQVGDKEYNAKDCYLQATELNPIFRSWGESLLLASAPRQ